MFNCRLLLLFLPCVDYIPSTMGVFWQSLKVLFRSLFVIYGIIPALLILYPDIHRVFIFFAVVKWPFTNYTDLTALGVENSGRSFFINSLDPSIQLGVWHILPKNLSSNDVGEGEFEHLLSRKGYPVIVYYHGRAKTRTELSRVVTYNVLTNKSFHVLALDYRGFADSSGYPTEDGVVQDSIALYRWARERAGTNPVFIWGHSLGTAIGTRTTVELCKEGDCPDGLVLEAPFNNLTEVIRHHPFTYAYRWLPFFEFMLVKPCRDQGLHMNTDEIIGDVECPILVLHAKDDGIVPFHLALQLRDRAKEHGRDVTFIEFDHPHNYGHKFICRAPELPDIVYEFVHRCLTEESRREPFHAPKDVKQL